MKKTLFKLTMFTFLILGARWSASAQVYVQIRPVAPVVIQTARPSPLHIWIGEEWEEDGHGYKYVGGHWATAPNRGDSYHQGHWNHDNHGDHWEHGEWVGKKR